MYENVKNGYRKFDHSGTLRNVYEGLLRTKYRICIYPCYVAHMNALRIKSINKQVPYKLQVSDKTKRCLTQVKDVLTTRIEELYAQEINLRTFARNFSNIDFFLKILPLKDGELAMSKM